MQCGRLCKVLKGESLLRVGGRHEVRSRGLEGKVSVRDLDTPFRSAGAGH